MIAGCDGAPARQHDLGVLDPRLVHLYPHRRIKERSSALYVELTTVPGTNEDPPLATVAVLVRPGGEVGTRDAAVAERPTVVGAVVAHGEDPALDVEHRDRGAKGLHASAGAWRQVGQRQYHRPLCGRFSLDLARTHDVASSSAAAAVPAARAGRPYNARAFSLMPFSRHEAGSRRLTRSGLSKSQCG